MSSTTEMSEPICLIKNTKEGKLCINEDAVQILDKITQPVVVVAIVGLYRTGKSYLLNRLAGKNSGFALGNTIMSKTKGIWMWCVPHPWKENHTLVLLDTEGLGDVKKGNEQHDMWIFTLAVLLSSTLVYNSMNTIDNSALEKLHIVAKLSEHIKVNSGPENLSQSTNFMHIFPSFVWTVRDFTLDLELNGSPITADQYLENALEISNVEVKDTYNRIRSHLRTFFPKRKCFVFDCPASSKKLKEMENLTDKDLDESFVKQVTEFCEYIYNESNAKTMGGGQQLTGRMLSTLTKTYVEAICSGQVPTLDNAVESLTRIHNSRAVTEALEFYQTEVTKKVQFPTETKQELSNIHAAAEKQAISIFTSRSFNDVDCSYQMELKKKIENEYEKFNKQNMEESHKRCRAIISQVFGPLESAVNNGSYSKIGGYMTYCSDLEKAIKDYRLKRGRGFMSEEVLTAYLTEKKNVGQNILTTDRLLNEKQKKIEDEQRQKKELDEKNRKLEEEKKIKEQQILDQQKRHEKEMRRLRREMEEQCHWERVQFGWDYAPHAWLAAAQAEHHMATLEGFFQAQELQREFWR